MRAISNKVANAAPEMDAGRLDSEHMVLAGGRYQAKQLPGAAMPLGLRDSHGSRPCARP